MSSFGFLLLSSFWPHALCTKSLKNVAHQRHFKVFVTVSKNFIDFWKKVFTYLLIRLLWNWSYQNWEDILFFLQKTNTIFFMNKITSDLIELTFFFHMMSWTNSCVEEGFLHCRWYLPIPSGYQVSEIWETYAVSWFGVFRECLVKSIFFAQLKTSAERLNRWILKQECFFSTLILRIQTDTLENWN